MSLERRRETRGNKEKESLQESSFRRLDFRPLQDKSVVEEKKVIKEEIVEELTEIEKNVLEIAKEILKLKRYDIEFEIESESQIQKYPIIEKLYAKCIAKLSYRKGYSKEEIFLAIRSLEEKNWIVTNERRTKLEILTNKKLIKILDFIKNNPGIHARDERIEKELKITRTPFLKHVMTLDRFNLIRSKKIGKTLHYFLADVPEDYDKFKIIFLNPLIPKLLEEIFKDEQVTVSKIGENLDMYSGTILYHIKKLKELNLVRAAKNKSDKKIFLINVELLKVYNEFFKEPDFTQLLKGL
ncbi:MAG: winged helix-turn-helix transcriptional regulator [Promethearchaeota archaeon]|nr:MAG: winged helix-turn-helix transcriptional regulator [Candidatus Lokiarchaeota archaeon]